MAWGTNNEYIIFPILELIKKEIGNLNGAGTVTKATLSTEASEILNLSPVMNKVKKYQDILNMFNSEDYTLELKKENPIYPKQLTRAIVTFDAYTAVVIQLLRTDPAKPKRLTHVSIDFVGKTVIEPALTNPYGMPPDIYLEYVKNGLYWIYYNRIVNNDTATTTQKNDASARMDTLHARNVYLREQYGVDDSAILTKEELFKYLPNPYMMSADDYRDYAFCFWVWRAEPPMLHPAITDAVKAQKTLKAQEMRIKYNIEVEGLTFEELNDYTENPLCMTNEDLKTLYDLKKKIVSLVKEETDNPDIDNSVAIGELNVTKYQLYDKYYLLHDPFFTDVTSTASGDYWTFEKLEEFLPDEEKTFIVSTILKIEISLNYDGGIFSGVKSELIEV